MKKIIIPIKNIIVTIGNMIFSRKIIFLKFSKHEQFVHRKNLV